ncbi:phospholipase [Pseudoduganella sp. LjRoot289]|uniref:phospholipase D-like domain-containing protein n=1 Tax=Pseudoduganella sp. LjRoot289 TaxID=3342314 RepID=UPI003ECFD419
MSMNDHAKLYQQKLGYNRNMGPYQSLSLPWWVRTPQEVYGPRHGCELEPLICGEHVFRRLEQDIRDARRCIDIISWGFDPGMVLVRGAAAQAGQRVGDLLQEIASREHHPVKVRIVVWHDDVVAQLLMKNVPGYYGLQFPAIGCCRTGYYSEDHQYYNAEWFDKACSNGLTNIEFRVRKVPVSFLRQSLSGEASPGSAAAFAGKVYATHHQKMILIDYVDPPKAVGYVMGHNFVTDFWDTEAHLFRDPRRERFHKADPSKAWRQGPNIASSTGAYVPGYQPTGDEIDRKQRAVQAYLDRDSWVAKPYQDVSCRLRGPVLWDLNHNFCQAWTESERPESLLAELAPLVAPGVTLAQTISQAVVQRIAARPEPDFFQGRSTMPASLFKLARGQHSVQLLRTQPLHGEKTIKECYANLTRQMQHYIFIQNQYIQYEPWAEHLKECVQRLRDAGYLKPIYVFILTSTPESDGMDQPTYDVASKVGQSETMVVEHNEALERAKKGKAARPAAPEELAKSGINVVMGSLWTCARPPKVGGLGADEYEEIYIHAKVAIVDDAAFTMGSANLNLRSMALDSELNVLSEAMDVAYKLRCDLFRQCTGQTGPEQFSNMALTFKSWQDTMQENSSRKSQGKVLEGQVLRFHVDRKPGKPVV